MTHILLFLFEVIGLNIAIPLESQIEQILLLHRNGTLNEGKFYFI